MPCSPIQVNRRFGRKYCLNFRRRNIRQGILVTACFFLVLASTLKMDAVISSKTSVKIYWDTRRHTPEKIQINTLCKIQKFSNVEAGGAYSYHCAQAGATVCHVTPFKIRRLLSFLLGTGRPICFRGGAMTSSSVDNAYLPTPPSCRDRSVATLTKQQTCAFQSHSFVRVLSLSKRSLNSLVMDMQCVFRDLRTEFLSIITNEDNIWTKEG
jgi:hypothetical protein